MKLRVTSGAVLAVFAGVASAQSQINIYGVLDAGLAIGSGGPNGRTTEVTSGLSQSSRFGFKGSEDLGNGLAVRFVLEGALAVDTGATDKDNLLFGREAWVGLDSKQWGSVALGRQYTPIYRTLLAVDPFGNNYGGTSGRLMKGETGGTRTANTVTYGTPTFAGFDATLAYAAGEVAGDTAKSRQLGASVGYQAGKLTLRVAHHQIHNATATDRSDSTLYMAKYDFGVVTGSIGYGVNDGMKGAKDRDLLLGVTVPLGQHKVIASYIRKDDRCASTDFDVNQVSVAYNYSLSKRTMAYAAYTLMSNTNFATTKFGTGPREFDLGLRHSF
jgi:predicted porin